MSRPEDELQIKEKIVLVTDICSSSEIMEDLLRRGNIIKWRNLLIKLKEYLAEASQKLEFELYKFTGDGWILLFDPEYSLPRILNFLSDLSKKFEIDFENFIYRHLESPPDLIGLTFGIDSGELVFIEMMEREEWVGRAINVACRLQGTINEIDILTGYRAIISNNLFQTVKNELDKFHPELEKRKLKNIIRGGEIPCCKLSITEIPFKIIKAIYYTQNNSVDVTQELVAQTKRNCIDIIVGNYILGGDPDPNVPKKLKVEYIYNGAPLTKDVKEHARIQLP